MVKIAKITGSEIDDNKINLQCEITEKDDIQEVKMFSQTGEISIPPKGSKSIIIPLGTNALKISVATNDEITKETIQEGEKLLYSSDGGAIQAKHYFKKDKTHVFNDGSIEAARKKDTTKLTMTGTDIQALATALLATGAFLPSGSPPAPATPVIFEQGEITSGTSEVLLP